MDGRTSSRTAARESQKSFSTRCFFAGWVGIFVTALNLLPVGQLDGGHILYVDRTSRRCRNRTFVAGAAGWMLVTGNHSYVLFLVLISVQVKTPPSAGNSVPSGDWANNPHRKLWLTLTFLFVGFTPIPLDVHSPADNESPPATFCRNGACGSVRCGRAQRGPQWSCPIGGPRCGSTAPTLQRVTLFIRGGRR